MYDKPAVNCSVYTGIKELLELRIRYLYDRFDLFIIAEADYTLSGKPKAFSLEQDIIELGLPTDKIQIVQVGKNDLPKYGETVEER